jgi:hypothetical protein
MLDELPEAVNETTRIVIGSSIKVHSVFGPGLLESAYNVCLVMVVNESVVVELKAIDRLAPIHTAQMITYLRLTGLPVGLLINFNVQVLKDGIKRVINRERASTGTATSSVP